LDICEDRLLILEASGGKNDNSVPINGEAAAAATENCNGNGGGLNDNGGKDSVSVNSSQKAEVSWVFLFFGPVFLL
jgi:hypothetical protein